MRILFIAPRPPFPPEGRETVRPYHHLRFLALKHDVDLVCFSGGGVDEWEARERLKNLCHRVQIIPLETPPQSPGRVTNLLPRRPLALRRYFRKDLQRRLRGIADTSRYDLVFVYSAAMAPYLEAFPETPRIVDLVEVGSLRWQESANLARFPASAAYRAEANRLMAVETRAAALAQRVLVASEDEAEALRTICPGNGRIHALKTPANPRAPLEGPWAADPTILFTGHFDHFPNADAAVRLVADMFPRIRERVRTARLVLAGRNPTGEIRMLATTTQGLTLAPPKADLRQLFREAWIGAAPHRIAHGVRNEVLEAMAAGIPVVASREAAKGLDVLPLRDLVVVDSPDQFVDRTVRLLQDPGVLERLGDRGRRAVQNNYSHWSVSLRLEELVAAASVEEVTPA